MGEIKSFKFIITRGVFAFVMLFLLVKGLSYLDDLLGVQIVSMIVEFLDLNLNVLIIVFIIAILAQIVNKLMFPFNLPAPILKAIPIVYAVKLCVIFLAMCTSYIGKDFSKAFYYIVNFGNPIIFIAILVVGYASIFIRLSKGERHDFKRRNKDMSEDKKDSKKKDKKDAEKESEGGNINVFMFKILDLCRDGLYRIFKFLSDLLERKKVKK